MCALTSFTHFYSSLLGGKPCCFHQWWCGSSCWCSFKPQAPCTPCARITFSFCHGLYRVRFFDRTFKECWVLTTSAEKREPRQSPETGSCTSSRTTTASGETDDSNQPFQRGIPKQRVTTPVGIIALAHVGGPYAASSMSRACLICSRCTSKARMGLSTCTATRPTTCQRMLSCSFPFSCDRSSSAYRTCFPASVADCMIKCYHAYVAGAPSREPIQTGGVEEPPTYRTGIVTPASFTLSCISATTSRGRHRRFALRSIHRCSSPEHAPGYTHGMPFNVESGVLESPSWWPGEVPPTHYISDVRKIQHVQLLIAAAASPRWPSTRARERGCRVARRPGAAAGLPASGHTFRHMPILEEQKAVFENVMREYNCQLHTRWKKGYAVEIGHHVTSLSQTILRRGTPWRPATTSQSPRHGCVAVLAPDPALDSRALEKLAFCGQEGSWMPALLRNSLFAVRRGIGSPSS